MPRLKLTDADHVIPSAEGAREAGLVLPVPKSLKIAADALEAAPRSVLKKELLAERPSLPRERAWSDAGDGTKRSLVITPAGLTAFGISAAGNASALEGEVPRAKLARWEAPQVGSVLHQGIGQNRKDERASGTCTSDYADTVVAAIRQRNGATIPELMDATGRQAHPVRGSITLNQSQKMTVAAMQIGGMSGVGAAVVVVWMRCQYLGRSNMFSILWRSRWRTGS